MQLIATKSPASTGTTQIVFNNLPQDGDDLVIIFNGHNDGTYNAVTWSYTINGDTNDYINRYMYGEYSGSFQRASNAQSPIRITAGNAGEQMGGNSFASYTSYLGNYSKVGKKPAMTWGGFSFNPVLTISTVGLYAHRWGGDSSPAVTSLTFNIEAGSWSPRTTISIYKLRR
jgi:hypothetical protein